MGGSILSLHTLDPSEEIYEEIYEETNYIVANTEDITSEITYKLLLMYFDEELQSIAKSDNRLGPISLKSRVLKDFIYKLEISHSNIIKNCSSLVKELFFIYQITRALDRYNLEILKLGYVEFRAKIYYPNVIYLLIRFLPQARRFLQICIKDVYNELQRKSKQLLNVYIYNFATDPDLIKHDALYEFLGNSLKKMNPLVINNLKHFYRSVFRNILFYHFKDGRKITCDYSNMNGIEVSLLDTSQIPTRLSIYRDVLYNLQNEKFVTKSPTLYQLGYNYKVFKNVILDNEFQNMYYTTFKDSFVLNDNQYKVMKVHDDDIKARTLEEDDLFIQKLKQLPTIYRLLKCVRIVSSNYVKPHNEHIIKLETVRMSVLEEMVHPFKNLISEQHIVPVLNIIADNFTNSILSGEYINLLTLSSVHITQISFISQLRKFIRLCLEDLTTNTSGK